MSIADRCAALVPPAATAENVVLAHTLAQMSRDLSIERWKVAKAALVSVGVLGLAGFAILEGARSPGQIAIAAIVVTALINGIEFSELIATWAAVREEQARDDDER